MVVEVKLEKELLYIEGSPVHLTKALMNLCSNAAEAMPEGGKITLTTKNLYPEKTLEGYDIDNFVVVSISDTGVGITQQDLKRIFEPFYTKKEMGLSGTGLGMTIVWNTINDHNGYINIGSVKGKGTTFELYFPVSTEAAFQGRKTIGIEEYLGNGERILVVDDVLEQREILTVLLNELGYSVKSVANGEDAVEHMRTHTNDVDLVVLDMIMDPGMDGLDTYEKILKIQPGIKAIIASGFSETERVKKTMKMGAGSYIQKPYTLEKIGSALKRELER
jgi:CheY-like chemotaxis protein